MIHQFTHIIHNLLVVPTYEKCSIYDAEQCNNQISLLVNMKLQNRLESLFDRIVPHNMILTVDTLTIDFGEIEMEEMNSVFVDKVVNLIEIELKKLLKDKLIENLNSEKTLYIEVSNNSVYYYEKQLKFENEIENAIKRGVRVILFSNPNEGIGINGIEQYGYFKERWSDDERIMVVADYKEVMIGGGKKGSKITGTFSENPVLVQIVSEHINHDIYFSKLQKKYNKSVVIEEEERTGTIAEKKFFEELKKRVK